MILRPRFVQKPFLNFWYYLIMEYMGNVEIQLEDCQVELIDDLIKAMEGEGNYVRI